MPQLIGTLFVIYIAGCIIYYLFLWLASVFKFFFWNFFVFSDWYFHALPQLCFLNNIQAWKPEFSWAIGGFILFGTGYFVLMEAHKFHRSGLEYLFKLLFVITFISPFFLTFLPKIFHQHTLLTNGSSQQNPQPSVTVEPHTTKRPHNQNLITQPGAYTGTLIGWEWETPPCDPPGSCGAGGSKPVYTVMLKDINLVHPKTTEFYYGLNVTRNGQPIKQFATCDQQPTANWHKCFQNLLKEHLKSGANVTVHVTCGKDQGCYARQIDLKTDDTNPKESTRPKPAQPPFVAVPPQPKSGYSVPAPPSGDLTSQQHESETTVVKNEGQEAKPKEPARPDYSEDSKTTPRKPPKAKATNEELDMFAPPKKY